ncbi:polysaccharide deacetylase family protein [Exilibacterium tricleocarpae]|nr:polysaccharide deacetylase family protein [Exilibacterium tricleocarpae]
MLTAVLGAKPAGAAVVLQYHYVDDTTPAITSVTVARFREHMAYLKDRGFQVVALGDLVARLRAGKPLPDRAVALTFDDGYRSVYTEAFPLLRRQQWPFTVFINPAAIDGGSSQFVTWDQLREMRDAGAEIANHSNSHAHLLRRGQGEGRAAWERRVRGDIEAAQVRIKAELGAAPRLFAYPYGEYDTALLNLLRELDYAAVGQHSGALGSGADLQALPRFPFGGSYGDAEDFAAKVNSLPLPVTGLRLLDEKRRPLTDLVLPQQVARPWLEVQLADPKKYRAINCFASGQGRIEVQYTDTGFAVQAPRPLPVGRSRYNCTHASAERGRFYWMSQPFIRKKADGSWYSEP